MPYTKRQTKKSKRSFRKRRNFRKKTTTGKSSAMVTQSYRKSIVDLGPCFPDKVKMTLRYTDNVILTSAAGTPATYQMVLNGLYDPNYTSTGHQPIGFDNIMNLYNHYHVIGCKMTVRFVPYEANTIPSVAILTENDDTSITSITVSTLQEQSKAGFTIIGSDGSNYSTLVLKWAPKKTFGGSLLANNALRGNATNNPSELCFGNMSVVAADNAATVSVACVILMEYVAIFSELKDLVGS